jgi:hypothetical protein
VGGKKMPSLVLKNALQFSRIKNFLQSFLFPKLSFLKINFDKIETFRQKSGGGGEKRKGFINLKEKNEKYKY